jgi:NitT/TauT family transport system substrate-binding protein
MDRSTVGRLALGLGVALLLACGAPAERAGAPAPQTAAPPAASSAPTATAEATPPSPPVTVNVGTLGLTSDAGVYIALERGYFREQGLDVRDTRFDAGARVIPALAAGQIDVGGGSPSSGLFNAMARGIGIEIVADRGRAGSDSSYMAFVLRRDLAESGAVREPADFRGRRVATIANDNANVIQFDRYMRAGGLTYKDADMVVMPGGDMIAALANGSIDMAAVAEPIPTRAVAAGAGVRWKGSHEVYPQQQAAVLMFSPTFGQANPDAARRFLVAYLQGVRAYYDAFFRDRQRDEVVAILTRTTSLNDPRLYDEMVPFAVDPDGWVNEQSLTDDLDWLVREGLVPERPDLGRYLNRAYLDHALARLGPYAR